MVHIEEEKHESAKINASAPLSSKHAKRKRSFTALTRPVFTSSTAYAKYHHMKDNLLTGSIVCFHGFSHIANLLKTAHLGTLCILKNKVVYNHMVAEFFCIMIVQQDVNGYPFISTTVCSRPLMLDEYVLNKILNLPSKMLKYPRLDLSAAIFRKINFHAYLNLLCESSVPVHLFEYEVPMSSDYFSPPNQLLAHIFRANIFPKLGSERIFSYAELRFMCDILLNKLHFNLAHFVLSQMINACTVGYFTYGLFLT